MEYSHPTLGVNSHVTFEPRGHGVVSGALSVWPFWVQAEDMQQEWLLPRAWLLSRAWLSIMLVDATQNARGWDYLETGRCSDGFVVSSTSSSSCSLKTCPVILPSLPCLTPAPSCAPGSAPAAQWYGMAPR